MAVTVETLEKLERKITLSLPLTTIQTEVDSRLKRMARTVKMDGFRPGKVPMNVVAQRYGYSVQYEVLNDKVGEAFAQAVAETGLRVAGQPRISEKEGAAEGHADFEAVFEVFPEVKIGDLAGAASALRAQAFARMRKPREASDAVALAREARIEVNHELPTMALAKAVRELKADIDLLLAVRGCSRNGCKRPG